MGRTRGAARRPPPPPPAEPHYAAPVRRGPPSGSDVIGLFPEPGAMSVAIVDYGSGNLHSAAKAFERAARDAGKAQAIKVTSDPAQVAAASRVVLPGVGAFADCRRGLDAIPGMVEALNENVLAARPAVLRHLRRHAVDGRARARISGDAGAGLDRRRGRPHRAVRSEPEDPAHGLEHAQHAAAASAARRIALGPDGLHGYFVHSYELKPAQRADLVAQADYGGPLTAIVGRDNMVGTQFHPEKSQRLGLALIANFLKWTP